MPIWANLKHRYKQTNHLGKQAWDCAQQQGRMMYCYNYPAACGTIANEWQVVAYPQDDKRDSFVSRHHRLPEKGHVVQIEKRSTALANIKTEEKNIYVCMLICKSSYRERKNNYVVIPRTGKESNRSFFEKKGKRKKNLILTAINQLIFTVKD